MTRILSLGQNNGLTVMILNLAPLRSYHLDTLSSLNFANRTKRIEVNEVENEPIFASAIATKPTLSLGGPSLNRQPLRQLAPNAQMALSTRRPDKPVKAFSVYTDKRRSGEQPPSYNVSGLSTGQKRPLEASSSSTSTRPLKAMRPSGYNRPIEPVLSKADIEALIEKRIDAKIAEKALSEQVKPVEALNADLQARLTSLEQRVAEKEDSEGLQYLLMAKQHHARGEDASALKMYQLAQPFFPRNGKLASKIAALQERMQRKKETPETLSEGTADAAERPRNTRNDLRDEEYHDEGEENADDSFVYKPKRKPPTKAKVAVFRDLSAATDGPPSPRTQQLLNIINTRDLAQIKLLKGVGIKKAELIVSGLCEIDGDEEGKFVTDLEQLGALKGVGWKTVENMRMGLGVF